MKYVLLPLLLTSFSFAEVCQVPDQKKTVFTINNPRPDYLSDAKITTVLANGQTTTVSSDDYMVVKRKQYTVLAGSSHIEKKDSVKPKIEYVTKTVNISKKNTVFFDVRRDITSLDSSTDTFVGGVKVRVGSNKSWIPALNYYRHDIVELLDVPVGSGVGVDTNGIVKFLLGFDF